MNLRHGTFVLAALVATWTPVALRALPQSGQATAPSADSATFEALLKASPGTYVVTNGNLQPAEEAATVPIFVQADAQRGAQGLVQVRLAVSGDVAQAWTMRLRVTRVGDGTAGRDNVATTESIAGPGGTLTTIREFTLAPGSYETVVALTRRGSGSSWIGTVVRHPLVVPDLWANRLTVGQVVLGDRVAAARSEEKDRPFTFGSTSLIPATVNRFRQADDLHMAFRIYGWKADADAKPDLNVEYVFYQKTGARFRFFNKTKAQPLNPQTLASAFDGSSGTVATGMSVPLGSFPTGEFEVTVRVLDKRTQASAAQKAGFFVID